MDAEKSFRIWINISQGETPPDFQITAILGAGEEKLSFVVVQQPRQ